MTQEKVITVFIILQLINLLMVFFDWKGFVNLYRDLRIVDKIKITFFLSLPTLAIISIILKPLKS